MMTNLKKELADMPLDQLIQRINEYTRTSRERDLTELETAERQLHRMEYIRRIGNNMRATLDNTTIEFAEDDENGSNG